MLSHPKVSVVIPSYNEGSYLGRLLDALTRQNFVGFEVIISDAQSKDSTPAIVDTYKSRLDLKFIQTPPRGPAAGRNRGAQLATGEWLLFLDADDDIDDPNFISELINVAEFHSWGTASARIKHADASWREQIGSNINYHYIKLLAKTRHPVAPGWCILTRRSVFEKNQGFNEKIHFGEDYDYVTRVGGSGFGFVESTYYYVDLRRPREEGWRLTYKAVANEIYRHTHKYNLENNPYKYEFGKHRELKK